MSSQNHQYVLITGGLGFIGAHVVLELIEQGYVTIIVDDLSNSKMDQLLNIATLVPSRLHHLIFYQIDLRDPSKLKPIFDQYSISLVIHLAGVKALSESIVDPLKYYDVNVISTINLLKVMQQYQCKKLIFSSSATVYGQQTYPVDESAVTGHGITSPYGQTKYMIEQILTDLYHSDPTWSIVILRYFNPIGHHPSGLLKENPVGTPNNLFPYIIKVAEQTLPCLSIYGHDYPTPDGTCIRDFIHVSDLAKGHVVPITCLSQSGINIYNLGTGQGTSVLSLIKTFIETNQIDIPYQFVSKRQGDLPVIFAKVDKIKDQLGWQATMTIKQMCQL